MMSTWNLIVLPGNTTLTYKTVVMYWEELSWSPLAKEPGRAAWKYDTDVQNRADVIPTLLDVLERSVVESAGLDWRVQSQMTTL